LWDLATGRQLGDIVTGFGAINAVAFSPDGTTLATGDDDGAARLWKIDTSRQIPDALPKGSDPNPRVAR